MATFPGHCLQGRSLEDSSLAVLISRGGLVEDQSRW